MKTVAFQKSDTVKKLTYVINREFWSTGCGPL